MGKITDKININLNQNLWVLIVSLLGLGFSEYFILPKLESISFILSLIASFSIVLCLFFYTINYCKDKWKN